MPIPKLFILQLNRWLFVTLSALLFTACATAPKPPEIAVVKPVPKIALVLGGGGTRGFAHIGVIKWLETQGIKPDIIVGTSVGSMVGALYARGYSGFELQELFMQMEEKQVIDLNWLNLNYTTILFNNFSVLKAALFLNPIEGEALEKFINRNVHDLPIEKLGKTFAAVATDMHSGEMMVFRSGNTGMAVHASSAVPYVFKPVHIKDRYYVDGGLVSPVPVSVARSLGADFIIAVDISSGPKNNKIEDRYDELMQTFDIVIQTINRYELPGADIVIHPDTSKIDQANLSGRHKAVLEGEKAANAQLAALKDKLKKQ